MTRGHILAAAAALQEFSTSQLAAYCGAGLDTVEGILSGTPNLVKRVAQQRWRVVDLAAIRLAAAREAAVDGFTESQRPSDVRGRAPLVDRLVQAERVLVECSDEESPAVRHVMTATARNNLLQVAARVLPARPPWWSIEASDALWSAVGGATDDSELSRWRLRADFRLAAIIDAEAASEPIAADYLTQTAVDLSHLATSAGDAHLSRLVEYFVNLTATLAEPAGLTSASEPAPARLLVALAWHRARVLVGEDMERAMKTLVQILRQLSQEPRTLDEHAIDFFRLIGQAPGGGNRVVVYRGLLDLLPQRTDCRTAGDFQPGILVEAVTDPETSSQLKDIAGQLRDGLERSPSRSQSALIGTAAHVLHNVAMTTATRDSGVLPRSDLVRKELLKHAGAPL